MDAPALGGDTLILLVCFWIVSLLFRSRQWIIDGPSAAVALFIALGLVNTIFSEWYNTKVRVTWQYAPSMPVIPE